jgi:2-polyprenyl-3-methyl-5-hydroxy-6-metoxy-1,4-benzoquinol methylase
MVNWIEKKGRGYFRCPGCHFTRIPDGVMTTESGQSIYEDASVFTQDWHASYYLDDSNLASFRLKLNWIKEYIPDGRLLLDSGANFGHFLFLASQSYGASGFDISHIAVAWSQKNLNVHNRVASIYDISHLFDEHFDVVTCWDTLEHLEKPLEALQQLFIVLKPGGYLFLSTPDMGSLLARLMGRYWHYLNSVEHIALFTRNNIKRALDKSGFDVIEFRTFGHYYRGSYIVNQLYYIHQKGFLKTLAQMGQRMPSFILDKAIYLQLGDVMGIACRKRR